MEILGLLHRCRDTCDERVVRVSPTQQGRALQAQVAPIRAKMLCTLEGAHEALAGLQRDLAAVTALLRSAGE